MRSLLRHLAIFSGRPTLAGPGKRGRNHAGRRPGRAGRRDDALARMPGASAFAVPTARWRPIPSRWRGSRTSISGWGGRCMRGIMTLGSGDDAGLPRLALLGQRCARSVAPEEEKKTEISGWMVAVNLDHLAWFLHLHVQVCAAAGGHQAEEPLSRLRQPDPVQRGGRRHPHLPVPAVYLGHLAAARHQARLPVSRRRAQDRLRLRDTTIR